MANVQAMSSKDDFGVRRGLIVYTAAGALGLLHCWEVFCYHGALHNLPIAEQKVAAMKTETAFYYSYFEEVVLADTWQGAVRGLLRDDRSEAPSSINALYRFNVYEELFAGLSYRVLRDVLGVSSVFLDPWHFYKVCSHALQGFGHFCLGMLAALLGGGGVRGGVLPIVALGCWSLLHRSDTSRVADVGMLPLRETWTVPILFWQVLALHRMVICRSSDGWPWAFWISTTLCHLFWQFSGFAFMLQVAAVFLCSMLSPGAHARRLALRVVQTHLACLLVAAGLLFGSDLLLFHMLAVECTAIWAVLCFRPRPPARRLFWWLDGALAVALFLVFRALQSRWATAEEHIGEIFIAKVRQAYPGWLPGTPETTEPTFNARLYMAVSVFDFISAQAVRRGLPTMLYHFASAGLLLCVVRFAFRPASIDWRKRKALRCAAGKVIDAGQDLGNPDVPAVAISKLGALANAEKADDLVQAPALRRRPVRGRRAREGTAATTGPPQSNGSGNENPAAGKAGREATAGCMRTESCAQEEWCDALESERAAIALGVFAAQLVLFLALGCFISRLKVIGGPLLCVLAAVSPTPGLVGAVMPSFLDGHSRARATVVFSVGCAQISQLLFLGRLLPFGGSGGARSQNWVFQDGERAELYQWVTDHLPAQTIVTTSMPLSAELRLNTPVRMVIHPQFEAKSLRDRVQDLYKFYMCAPPAIVAESMRAYDSTHIVLEYRRCDFSPFLLDKGRGNEYNCAKGDRRWEDLFCPAAHVSPLFRMRFVNAGFAIFELEPIGGSKIRGLVGGFHIADVRAWQPALSACMQEAGVHCPSRIADLALMFHSKLKQQNIARMLLRWVTEHGESDGRAQFVLGNHADFDLKMPEEAGRRYGRAAELLPNSPTALREYMMWLELEAKDTRRTLQLLAGRRHRRGALLSLSDMRDVSLACEAAVTVRDLLLDDDWSDELWRFAADHGRGSSCVKNNWPLFNNQRSMEDTIGRWGVFFDLFWRRALSAEMQSVASQQIRFEHPKRRWNFSVSGLSMPTEALQ